MRSTLLGSFFALCLALAGCNNTPAATDSGSGPVDTGTTPVDTGTTPTDTGTTPTDTGTTPEDTGTTPTDTGTAMTDAGPTECAADFAGCTTLTDMTGMAAVTVTITADGTFGPYHYSPNCLRISAGTTVNISAAAIHPLTDASCSPAGSPIPTGAIASGDYTFEAAGNYGYYCSVHGSDLGTGMAGLIVVE